MSSSLVHMGCQMMLLQELLQVCNQGFSLLFTYSRRRCILVLMMYNSAVISAKSHWYLIHLWLPEGKYVLIETSEAKVNVQSEQWHEGKEFCELLSWIIFIYFCWINTLHQMYYYVICICAAIAYCIIKKTMHFSWISFARMRDFMHRAKNRQSLKLG